MLSIKDLRCFVLLLWIGLSSCHSSNNKEVYADGILRIKVCPTKDNVNYLYASEVISDIEYIPLETSAQCLLNQFFRARISENYILVKDGQHCILFSRQGKYIRHIGSQGQGPEEYNMVDNVTIDEKSNMIYMSGMYELLAYRISGEFVKKLNLRKFCEKTGITGPIQKVVHWKDNLFCANIFLSSGKEKYHFVFFSLDGQVIKLLPNFIERERHFPYLGVGSDFANIYLYNGQLSYKKMISDTLFRINDRLEFVPEVIFDFCGRNVPANIWTQKVADHSMYTLINDIRELENYILFSCDFGNITPKGQPASLFASHCLYDKNSKELTILKRDWLGKRPPPIVPPSPVLLSNNNNDQLIDYYSEPIINDIDGGYDLYFIHSQLVIIQNAHQLMCKYIQADNLLNDMNEKYFASKKIKDKEAHERLKNLLANLKEDDNPILMIATFK